VKLQQEKATKESDGQWDLVKSKMIAIQKSIKRLKYTKGRKRTNTAKTVKSPPKKKAKKTNEVREVGSQG
jgi:hypothetical protein